MTFNHPGTGRAFSAAPAYPDARGATGRAQAAGTGAGSLRPSPRPGPEWSAELETRIGFLLAAIGGTRARTDPGGVMFEPGTLARP
jgi:hypothetical protein